MFDKIRYELNDMNFHGVEIVRNRNVRVTNIIKNYVSLTYDKSLITLNAGTLDPTRRKDTLIFVYGQHAVRLLRGLQMCNRQCSP